jgi:hypothetical protein
MNNDYSLKTVIWTDDGELGLGVRDVMPNATFNNISAISWRWVLLVEGTTDKLYHLTIDRNFVQFMKK